MGRGGAKMGKEVKGAGALGDDQINESELESVDEDDDLNGEDYEELLGVRDGLKEWMQGLGTEFGVHQPMNSRRLIFKWRAFMRRQKRADSIAAASIAKSELDTKVEFMDCAREDQMEVGKRLESLRVAASQRHARQIETLLEQFIEAQLLSIGRQDEESKQRLGKDFEVDRSTVSAHSTAAKRHIDAAVAELVQVRNEDEEESTQKREVEREQFRSNNLEIINDLRILHDKSIEELENRFDTAHASYVQVTEERAKEFKFYNDHDQVLSDEIEKKITRIEVCVNEILKWKKKGAKNVSECEKRNEALRGERTALQAMYFQLKEGMEKQRGAVHKKLKALTKTCRDAKKDLQLRVGHAERILRQIDLAKKVEEEDERDMGVKVAPDELRLMMGEEIPGHEKFKSFNSKLSAVTLSKIYAVQKRNALQMENDRLKEVLRKYLDSVNVTPVTLDQNNSLMVINGRHNIVRALPKKPFRPPAVDGVNAARNYALQNYA